MIEISEKKNCCGCSACVNACPKNCIEMRFDEEGFAYPFVDKTKCVNCNLCVSACPILNKQNRAKTATEAVKNSCPQHRDVKNTPPHRSRAYAAYNKDLDVRLNSSSGGIFSLLANLTLKKGGVVFGAIFNDKFQVVHGCGQSASEVEKMRVSKYVQSDIRTCYREAKRFLDEGKEVLFTGTPCQIEGLLTFLRKKYDNLITQDLICHGVPSPKIWEGYVKLREEKAGSKIKQVQFRKKVKGWKGCTFYMKFEDETEYSKTPYYKDPMLKMFFLNKSLRPSCHACTFKNCEKVSDITLADFWKINKFLPEMNDNKGISLVLTHTEKGEKILAELKEQLVFQEVDYAKATKSNPMINRSAMAFQRKSLMRDYQKKPFEKVVKKYGSHLF